MLKNKFNTEIRELQSQISKCVLCEKNLEHGPNPIVKFSEESRILIIGQAPGLAVHKSSIPWDDKSGDNLRKWMNIDKTMFYDERLIGILPMGFCYPGKGKSGDLPPRKECAPQWHTQILNYLTNVDLILLIGKYSQDYYLGNKAKRNLTETVRNFQSYLPRYFVLPHPSPRNNIWLKKNDWFESEVLPRLRTKTLDILKKDGYNRQNWKKM